MSVVNHFKKTVTAAGTAEALKSSDFWVSFFSIQSLDTNTNKIYVGGSSVSSSSYGVYLSAAGAAVGMEQGFKFAGQVNLKNVYIDAGTNGEGVAVFYVQT